MPSDEIALFDDGRGGGNADAAQTKPLGRSASKYATSPDVHDSIMDYYKNGDKGSAANTNLSQLLSSVPPSPAPLPRSAAAHASNGAACRRAPLRARPRTPLRAPAQHSETGGAARNRRLRRLVECRMTTAAARA